MRLEDLEAAYGTFTRDLLARAGFSPERFHLEVAPEDEMFFKGVLPSYPGKPGAAFFHFVESSLRTFHVYDQLAAHLGGFPALDAVLDFGAGYGRLTRCLVERLPRERVWVSDIYPHAVGWQVERFGVNGVVSASEPGRYALPLSFSMVFAASVFSHLPDPLFRAWLRRLYALVAPGGLLAFSVHDAAFAPPDQAIGPGGMGYAPWSESGSLDSRIYGMSYVTVDYVADAISEACGSAQARRFPHALFENQDLWVVAGEGTDLADLRIIARPLAGFETFGRADRPWSGWAFDPNPGSQIVRADLFVDDRQVAAMTPTPGHDAAAQFFRSAPHPPVSWRFDPTALDREVLVRVDLTSRAGTTASCYGQTLAAPGPGAPRT
jgi:SAM-dependent methyltransferase